MRIQYVGHKKKMTVRLPLLARKSKQTTLIHFAPGDTHDFSDEDGQTLLNLNPSGNYRAVDVPASSEAPAPVPVAKVADVPKKRRGRPPRVKTE